MRFRSLAVLEVWSVSVVGVPYSSMHTCYEHNVMMMMMMRCRHTESVSCEDVDGDLHVATPFCLTVSVTFLNCVEISKLIIRLSLPRDIRSEIILDSF